MERSPDIVIFGAGIAGLWTFHQLKRRGYDVLLLENDSIGCGQTIAAQGILHSGLKFSLAGKVNDLAQQISKMPDIWRASLQGNGPVDLRQAKVNAESQLLLILDGFVGGITKLVTQKVLGSVVREIPQKEWPDDLKNSGFKGSVINMNELVLDIPSTLRALANPYKDCIRKFKEPQLTPLDFLQKHNILTKKIIYTGAAYNLEAAKLNKDDTGLQTQTRPLLQGMMKNAPFPLYAHLVGKTDKPVATITTHKTLQDELVWYLGASVAERSKDSDPQMVYKEFRDALKRYMPNINLNDMEWACLPIDRVEGKSNTDHWMPDTPTIHRGKDALYCWPTKLTFAPMLADMIEDILISENIKPSSTVTQYDFLPAVDFAICPWDDATWTK